jgi:hypothetical protein
VAVESRSASSAAAHDPAVLAADQRAKGSAFAGRLALLAGGIVASLVCSEAVLRLTAFRQPVTLPMILERTDAVQRAVRRRGPRRIFKLWSADEAIGWQLEADLEYPVEFVAHFDRRIARTNRFHMLDRAPDTTKQLVFVLGDSFVEGLPVAPDRHFCRQLEAEFPGHDFLNLGVSGYSSVQSYLHLFQRLREFAAAHVIFAIYTGNDFDENDPLRNNSMVGIDKYRRDFIPFLSPADFIVYGEESYGTMREWISRSHALRLAEHTLATLGIYSPYGALVSLRVVRLIKQHLDRLDIPLTVLLIPDENALAGSSRLYGRVHAAIVRTGAHTVSLLEPFQASGRSTMGYTDGKGRVVDRHWNGETHDLVTRVLRDALPLARGKIGRVGR